MIAARQGTATSLARRIILAVAAVVIVILIVVGVRGSGRQAAALSAERIAKTLAEVRRGNYFAWQQTLQWWNKLSVAERALLAEGCTQYASTNQSLHSKDAGWPPEGKQTSRIVRRVTQLTEAVFGASDTMLDYTEGNCFPALHNFPTAYFTPLFHTNQLIY